MKPGPKPLDLGFMKQQAYVWTTVLYRVRDGCPGYLAKIVGGSGKATHIRVMDGLSFFETVTRPLRQRQGLLPARSERVEVVATAVVLPEKLRYARQLLKDAKSWILTPPEPPRPEVWSRLKKARSVAEVRKIADELHRVNRTISAAQWKPLHLHARDFLRAKRLHSYPKSDRPRSDDKRIHFFAKILAGLMQGIAPATAIKRLSNLALPDSHDITREFEKSWNILFEDIRKGEKK
ncbi:MAG: hypothetical protein L0338_28805 [Acidobacteria bacterium]|nr:hypothetical protein [Acidobacteriota bacterium]